MTYLKDNRFINRVKVSISRWRAIRVLPHALLNIIKLYVYKYKTKGEVSIVILCEHIGDIIACEPVSTYLKTDRGKKVVWVVRRSYMDILSLFRNVDLILDVDCLSECIVMTYFMKSYEVHNLHFDSRVCTKYYLKLHNKNQIYSMNNYYYHGSLLETFSTVGNLPPLKMKPNLLLLPEDKFSKIKPISIAIHLDANEDSRKWGINKWENFLKAYPNIRFVEIGITPHLSHVSNCDSSFCGNLSLIDIAYLIDKCSAFVGIESSVAHYANALGKLSLIMIGKYRNFDYYVPYSEWDENFYMIHYNGFVKDLPLSILLDEFNKKILPYLKAE